MSLSVGVLIYDAPIEINGSGPWLASGRSTGRLCVAVGLDTYDKGQAVIQGTPEDMERLAEVATKAAKLAREREHDLRLKAKQAEERLS